jgi:hypothetical protein
MFGEPALADVRRTRLRGCSANRWSRMFDEPPGRMSNEPRVGCRRCHRLRVIRGCRRAGWTWLGELVLLSHRLEVVLGAGFPARSCSSCTVGGHCDIATRTTWLQRNTLPRGRPTRAVRASDQRVEVLGVVITIRSHSSKSCRRLRAASPSFFSSSNPNKKSTLGA